MCTRWQAREIVSKRGKIDTSLIWIDCSCFNGLLDSDPTNSVSSARFESIGELSEKDQRFLFVKDNQGKWFLETILAEVLFLIKVLHWTISYWAFHDLAKGLVVTKAVFVDWGCVNSTSARERKPSSKSSKEIAVTSSPCLHIDRQMSHFHPFYPTVPFYANSSKM